MYYLKLGKKLGQNTAYSMVDGNGTETSSNDQDDRVVCRQACILQTRKPISCQQLFTDRRTGEHRFVFWKVV